jgi:hypothetical protein
MTKRYEKKAIDKTANEPSTANRAPTNASPQPDDLEQENENPPRTTSKGWFTTPKFGSSTSGGGEIEPGPERD